MAAPAPHPVPVAALEPPFNHNRIPEASLKLGTLYKIYYPSTNAWRYGVLARQRSGKGLYTMYTWEPGYMTELPVNSSFVVFFDINKNMGDKPMKGAEPDPSQTLFDYRDISTATGLISRDYSFYDPLNVLRQLAWARRKHAVTGWAKVHENERRRSLRRSKKQRRRSTSRKN